MTQPEQPSSPASAARARSQAARVFTTAPTPAPFLSRAVAFVIDFGGTVAVTTGIVVLCVTIGFADYNGVRDGINAFMVLVGIAAIFLVPLAAVIINVRLAHTRSYSIGKFLMRIRVVDARTNGPAPIGRLMKRVGVLIVPALITVMVLPSLLPFIGAPGIAVGPSILIIIAPLLWVAVLVPMLRGDRRGWQDKAADTRVVTAASMTAPMN
jgi:hypothetical protein